MNFLNKLRKQPVRVRRIILWTTVIVLGLILGFLWIYSSYKSIDNLKKQNIIERLNLPEIPEIEMPEIEILETQTQNNL